MVTLTTGGGKTFVAGLLYQYFSTLKNMSVTMVVPNEELKIQMINLLGKMGRRMNIMTRAEHM